MLDCEVKDVKPLDDYRLLITFATGERKIFDCKSLLQYKINAPLKNKAFFATAKVCAGTVAWNEKIDIDPEYIYEKGVEIGNL